MNEITKISSRENTKLVLARKVRDGKIDDRIFIEGLRLADETVRSSLNVDDCFVTPAFAETERGRELIEKLEAVNVRISEVGEQLFRSIADTSNSQGIILIAERPHEGRTAIERNLQLSGTALVVFLHEISDPSNLGAVFRTAEAAGVAGIIVSEGSANMFSPKALRAAMGASLRVPVWESAGFSDAISWSREHKLRVTAADVGAKSTYTDINWSLPRLIIFGSEAHGLSVAVLDLVEEKMSIPMLNGVESLNLAVSTGIILFEAVRQRSK